MGNENNQKWDGVSKQISVYKTGKSLVELLDFLKPASKKYPAQLHASAQQAEGERSYVKINMLDYSAGTGDKSVNVSYNVSPEEARYIFTRVENDVREFAFDQEKIFGEPDKDGHSIVRKIRICRNDVNPKGEKMNYPWCIEVQNGFGVAAANPNGGKYCKKGTYKMGAKAKVNLTDPDFFALFSKADSFIRAFEMEHAYKENRIGNFVTLHKLILKALDERLGKKAS